MKRNILVLILLIFASALVFRESLKTFFAQDDFILINEFSQNSLTVDIKNVLGPPQVTHWRPMHNLYFLIAGNLFGKQSIFYHVFTFLIHISAAYLIFKVIEKITKSFKIALVAAFIYAIHSSHFVTLFWISGSATSIGFSLLLLSFYLYLQQRNVMSISSFLLSLLASEAMVAGVGLFLAYRLLFKDGKVFDVFTKMLILVAFVFVLIRLLFLTPQSTFDVYQIKFWPEVILNTKYYLLRIAGFAETSGDLLVSILLLLLLLFASFLTVNNLVRKNDKRIIVFGIFSVILGLPPFILVSNLSPHYMNISIFGFAILWGVAVYRLKPLGITLLLAIFLYVSIINVNNTYSNSWLVARSNLAYRYLQEIEDANLTSGSKIVFGDSYISTSREAYISLGTGKALNFWYKDKNYIYCFTSFEDCTLVERSGPLKIIPPKQN